MASQQLAIYAKIYLDFFIQDNDRDQIRTFLMRIECICFVERYPKIKDFSLHTSDLVCYIPHHFREAVFIKSIFQFLNFQYYIFQLGLLLNSGSCCSKY